MRILAPRAQELLCARAAFSRSSGQPLKLTARSHEVRAASYLILTLLSLGFSELAPAQSTSQCRLDTEAEFDRALTIIDSVVVASTFPGPPPKLPGSPEYYRALMGATATVVVLKSWKGRFRPGESVKIAQPSIMGGCCMRDTLPVGYHFIIFAWQEAEPLEITGLSVADSIESECTMQELDAITGHGQ